MPSGVYSRKVSSEEAHQGYVMVVKDRLPFFPPVGEAFALATESGERLARVESYHCECRGPHLPHEHYFIRLPGLATGDRVEIAKAPGEAGRYSLKVA